jgi:hypothetical protein
MLTDTDRTFGPYRHYMIKHKKPFSYNIFHRKRVMTKIKAEHLLAVKKRSNQHSYLSINTGSFVLGSIVYGSE